MSFIEFSVKIYENMQILKLAHLVQLPVLVA